MDNDTKKTSEQLQPINTPEQLIQFLKSIEDIKEMGDQQKYAHVFLIICKFLDMCEADNNLISEIAVNLMVSVVLGEAKGNVVVAKQLMHETVIPVFEAVGNDLENTETVSIRGFKHSNPNIH